MVTMTVSKDELTMLRKTHRLAGKLHDAWLGDPYGEPNELEIYRRVQNLMHWFDHLSMDEDEGTCPNCNGSGEGMRDGSTCTECGGRGE